MVIVMMVIIMMMVQMIIISITKTHPLGMLHVIGRIVDDDCDDHYVISCDVMYTCITKNSTPCYPT